MRDYRVDILDGGMTTEYAQYCVIHPTPLMFDLDEPGTLGADERPQIGGHRQQREVTSKSDDSNDDDESDGDGDISDEEGGCDGGRGGRGGRGRGIPQMRHATIVSEPDIIGSSVPLAPSSLADLVELSQIATLQSTVQSLQGQLSEMRALVAQLQGHVTTLIVERDTTKRQDEQAMALADSLQRAETGTLLGDMMREMTKTTREVNFYRIKYHDDVPPE